MSSRFVNLALLVCLSAEFVSGVVSYVVGTSAGVWVFWVHRIAGFAIVALLVWKIRIVAGSYRKRGATASTLVSALLGLLFLAALSFGLLWSTTGVRGADVPILGSLTGLGVHVALAVALLPLLVFHAIVRWPRVRARRADFVSRRAALRYLTLSATGLVIWRGSETLSAAAGWSGARRRFTGSREIGSPSGNAFPATNWFSDPKPRIDPAAWQLRIHGSVHAETTLALSDLFTVNPTAVRAILDCTGGWFTDQVWSGPTVSAILSQVDISADAQSLVFHSATGYTRRYALDELDQLILATHVSGEPLSRSHGYPVRLVAPGRRGYDWVKWVVSIEVSELPGWWQAPLPLQ